jgi:chromosome segregation ATPase
MSDNPTQEMPDSRSFEERVFARFDALDARISTLENKIDALDGRLTTLEEKVDTRLRETRPIWEAMQADLETVKGDLKMVKDDVKSINRRLLILHEDILHVKEVQVESRERIEKLESEPAR